MSQSNTGIPSTGIPSNYTSWVLEITKTPAC